MVTVGVDRAVVETALLGGELGCPALGCGRLAPWGWARRRMVRSKGVRGVRLGCGRAGRGAWTVCRPMCCCPRVCCCAARTRSR